MKPLLLNNSLLCAMMDTIAKRIAGFVTARALATIMPDHPVSQWHYNEWRDEALHNLRNALRHERAGLLSLSYQDWLKKVRSHDAQRGATTSHTPHKPGLFLR